MKELFEPITKAVTEGNQKLVEERKSTTKAIAALDGGNVNVKNKELTNKIGVIDSRLIRPIAEFLLQENRGQFRLYDDPYSKIGIFM